MEYVTIMEAARRCGVSDKTIRRAIHNGLLPARFPKPNRSEIALSDLERFAPGQTPGHVQVSTEDRITALEQLVLSPNLCPFLTRIFAHLLKV